MEEERELLRLVKEGRFKRSVGHMLRQVMTLRPLNWLKRTGLQPKLEMPLNCLPFPCFGRD